MDQASCGAHVLITYASSQSQAEGVCKSIRGHGVEAIAVAAAGTDPSAPSAVIEAVIAKWGVIDIIVNNAAAGGEFTLEDTTDESFDTQVAVNLRFPLLLIREAIPHFGPAPRIVNMSSIYARSGHAKCLVYSACKGAMESATRSLATELGHEYNATVNCVNPGPVNTDLWAKAIEDPKVKAAWERPVSSTPAAPRIAEPEDIAHIVAFLCDRRSRWTTGSVVNANGGMLFS